MTARARRPNFLLRLLADDGALIRIAFFAMLIGTASVLYVDFGELTAQDPEPVGLPTQLLPILPALDPFLPASKPGPAVTADRAALERPLTAELVGGGVLELTGTIDPGAYSRVLAEVERRREYIRTVALNSPGGSVSDALSIGQLVADEKFGTLVRAGGLCASSCPLIFASGLTRTASPQAAIGLHQIYATTTADALPTSGTQAAGEAMANAQRTTATITRHLTRMGVDPQVWLHAMETPPDRLYFLSPDELVDYRVVTALEPGGTGA